MGEMRDLTIVIGPSVSGKGTRIIKLMNQLGEPETWIRRVLPSYDKFKPIEREVGLYYPDHNLFFLGRHKKVGGWDSIDTLLNYRFWDVLEEVRSSGYKILLDVNSAFLGPKLLRCMTGETPPDCISMVGFVHTDMEEMFRRLNSRRGNKVWTYDSYEKTNAQSANKRTLRLLEEGMCWSHIRDRVIVNATEPKDYLTRRFL